MVTPRKNENTAIGSFNRDVRTNDGYLYTTGARLSSLLANRRLTDVTLAMADWRGRRVVDIGCGDGTYTIELYDEGRTGSIVGVDPCDEAVLAARRKVGSRDIRFEAHSAYALPYEANAFDIAYLRGVLHHMDQPLAALREAFRVAPVVVVIEPNGYNLGLKILERLSPYHRAHREKSYTSLAVDRWIVSLDGVVRVRRWVGFVPMFCPDWLARLSKRLEPVLEATPGVRQLACAQYVLAGVRSP